MRRWLGRITILGALVMAALFSILAMPIGRNVLIGIAEDSLESAGYALSVRSSSYHWPLGLGLTNVNVHDLTGKLVLEVQDLDLSFKSSHIFVDLHAPRLRISAVQSQGDEPSEGLPSWLRYLRFRIDEGWLEAGGAQTPALGPFDLTFEPAVHQGRFACRGEGDVRGRQVGWQLNFDPTFEALELRATASVGGGDLQRELAEYPALHPLVGSWRSIDATLDLSGPLNGPLKGHWSIRSQGDEAIAATLSEQLDLGGDLAFELEPSTLLLTGALRFDQSKLATIEMRGEQLLVKNSGRVSFVVSAEESLPTELGRLYGLRVRSLNATALTFSLDYDDRKAAMLFEAKLPPLEFEGDIVGTLALGSLRFDRSRAEQDSSGEDSTPLGVLSVEDLSWTASMLAFRAKSLTFEAQPASEESWVLDVRASPDSQLSGDNWRLALDQPGFRIAIPKDGDALLARGLALRGSGFGFQWTIPEATLRADNERRFVLETHGMSFADEAFESVGEGLAFTSTLLVAADEQASHQLTLRLDEGELLYRRLFLDATQSPIQSSFRMKTSPDSWRLQDASLGLGELLEVQFVGGRGNTGTDLAGTATIKVHQGDAAYRKLIQEPFGASFPIAATTSIEGQMKIDLEFARKGGSWTTMGGRLRSDHLNLALGDTAAFEGLRLDLPVAMAGRPTIGQGKGFIQTERLALIGANTEPAVFLFESEGSLLRLSKPWSLAAFDGVLKIPTLVVDVAADAARRFELSLAIEGVAVAPLLKALELPAVEGVFEADVASLFLDGDQIGGRGRFTLSAFGGALELEGPRADSVFSRVPEWGFDKIRIKGVDLEPLTAALPVGGVTGILDGEVEGLAIAAGQPVRFDASLGTVARTRVPQKISFTAIRQISILGGSGSDPLSQGVLSFFDEYRYAKMGLHCSLRNDRFVLRGVEEHEGRDFLVVGSWLPPTVNVISHNQVISFSEMVKRLSRATAGAETTEGLSR